MLRKISIALIFGVIIAGAVYGWMYYAIVGLYDTQSAKVSHIYLVKKPERSYDFLYNHINQATTKKEIAQLQITGQPIPWHMKHDFVTGISVYDFTLDNRKQN